MKAKRVDPPTRLRASVYAVVRVETDTEPDTAWENRITIVRVVADPEFADAEVERLNALNAHKGCRYFKQQTRFENPPVEVPSAVPADTAAAPQV